MADPNDAPAAPPETNIGQISLLVHASVVAAQSEGFALEDVLVHERVSADAWEAGNELWGEALLESAEGDLLLIEQHDAAVALARARMRRRVMPLDNDFEAWIAFQQQLLKQSDPGAFLSELGLESGDLISLNSQWAERLVSDADLRDALVRKMSDPVGEIPPVEFGAKSLPEPANMGPAITLDLGNEPQPTETPTDDSKQIPSLEISESGESELLAQTSPEFVLPWETGKANSPNANTSSSAPFDALDGANGPSPQAPDESMTAGGTTAAPSRAELWAMLGMHSPVPLNSAQQVSSPVLKFDLPQVPSTDTSAPSRIPQFDLPHVPLRDSSATDGTTTTAVPHFDLPRVPYRNLSEQGERALSSMKEQDVLVLASRETDAAELQRLDKAMPPTVVPRVDLAVDASSDTPSADESSQNQGALQLIQPVSTEPQLSLDLLALLESELEFFPSELPRILAKHQLTFEQLEIDRAIWNSRCRLNFELNQSYATSLSGYRDHWRIMASFR